jgi:hypothetical protein
VFSSSARAQRVELSSPLDGHARAGRAAAVRVVADGLAGPTLTIAGDGAVPVRIPTTAGRVDAVVPLLLTTGDPPAELRWSDGRVSGGVPFAARPLGPRDRLVVAVGDPPGAAELAADLFPGGGTAAGGRPVVVWLDTAEPRLLRPPQAYAAADAVLLDLSAAARVGESQLRAFLAAGTAVAIRSPERPRGDWPWHRRGAWWVLQHDPAGPGGGTAGGGGGGGVAVNIDAYAPTFAWDRAWPAALRRRTLLAAALLAMLLVGASLLRGRRGLVAAIGVCAAAGGAAAWFARSLAPVVTAAGEVVVTDGTIAQRDRWTYVSGLRDARTSADAAGVTRVVLGGRRQLGGLDLALACDADGSPWRYEFTLPAKQTVAFVSRSVAPAARDAGVTGAAGSAAAGGPVDTPIGLLADRLYPGAVVGRFGGAPADAAGEWWGTVVLRR